MCVNGGQGAMLATMAGTCMGVPIQKRIGGGSIMGYFGVRTLRVLIQGDGRK